MAQRREQESHGYWVQGCTRWYLVSFKRSHEGIARLIKADHQSPDGKVFGLQCKRFSHNLRLRASWWLEDYVVALVNKIYLEIGFWFYWCNRSSSCYTCPNCLILSGCRSSPIITSWHPVGQCVCTLKSLFGSKHLFDDDIRQTTYALQCHQTMVIQCWLLNLKNLLMKVLVDIGRTEENAAEVLLSLLPNLIVSSLRVKGFASPTWNCSYGSVLHGYFFNLTMQIIIMLLRPKSFKMIKAIT